MKDSGKMAIACIGWGSLIWDQQGLPVTGKWHGDGPMLPVEFARESEAGHLTLVICPNAKRVQTYWSMLDVADMQSAKERLGIREYPQAKEKWISDNIGFIDQRTGEKYGAEGEAIVFWANQHSLDGVVWTNLPCGFRRNRNLMPSGADVISHLRELDEVSLEKAEKYVRQAPLQIDTEYRRLIEKEFGWHPSSVI
jgi:hypothetical protein